MTATPGPWVRVIAVIRQATHPGRIATIDTITDDPDYAQARVRHLTHAATATAVTLPHGIAATQTVSIIPVPADIIGLIRRLTDPDPCTRDHHGTCQAHGQGSDDTCAIAQAQQLLAAWDEENHP